MTEPAPYTLLSQNDYDVLRVIQRYDATTLQQFTAHDCQQVQLNDAELQAFLRALPPETLRQALHGHDPSGAAWEAELAAGVPLTRQEEPHGPTF